MHRVSAVETHLSADRCKAIPALLEGWDWRSFCSPARPSGRSITGTSGGVLVVPWLHLQLDGVPGAG
eukprot:10745245-Lingulodinium_polyedra.AAC.1